MKKLKVLVVAVCLLIGGSTMAQSKLGYIKIDQVVALMPATAKLDSLMERYDIDSIQPEYTSLITNYQFKDSVYRDSIKTKKSVRDEIAKELPSYIYQIQNWSQIRQQAIEAKQNQILAPIYSQVYTALKAVAKEKGYTHVFDQAAFLVAPEGDDLFTAVAAKLKLTIPKNPNPAANRPAAPGGN
jgi:outer membrane protein